MSSILVQSLAAIFLMELKIGSFRCSIGKLCTHYRYVNDMFIVFHNEINISKLINTLKEEAHNPINFTHKRFSISKGLNQ